MSETTLTVGEALDLAAKAVATGVPERCWVIGEIESCRRSQAGHLYLSLRDEVADARLSVAILGRDAHSVLATLRRAQVELAEGMRVRLRGAIVVYPARGHLELRADAIDPDVSVGQAALALRRLRAALAAEGFLDRQKALAPPSPPVRVTVIGPAGQGVDDLVGLLRRSPWAIQVVHHHVPAEGPDAPQLIAHTIGSCVHADLIVLARGGGTGLAAAWDTEAVCRAVCASPVPVLVALGHASDHPLVEDCAWRHVPTPTAAAQQIVAAWEEADRRLVVAARKAAAACRAWLSDASSRLEAASRAIETAGAQADYASRAHRSAVAARRLALAAALVAAVLLVLLVLLMR
jgi:exodeoxyribonuclease VII large subunit